MTDIRVGGTLKIIKIEQCMPMKKKRRKRRRKRPRNPLAVKNGLKGKISKIGIFRP